MPKISSGRLAQRSYEAEVVVTYEMTKRNGDKGCNTEILCIRDNKIVSVEVYFGWDMSPDH